MVYTVVGLGSLASVVVLGTILSSYHATYSAIIDRRLDGAIFDAAARVYAAPRPVYPGQPLDTARVVDGLRRAGLEPDAFALARGTFLVRESDGDRVEIIVSAFDGTSIRMELVDEHVRQIVDLRSGQRLDRFELPAELLTVLSDQTRSRRRPLDRGQLPETLTDALIASEDRRFYDHGGIDLVRAVGAAHANFRGMKRQGASTLTMQLAGSFFLDRSERSWRRKLPEIFIALLLERRITKEQILTLYANEVYLGHRNSFAIRGFGQAAAVYFGKEIGDLTVGETATLVGMLPAPNAYSPSNAPERALERRDLVLDGMRQMGTIGPTEYTAAVSERIHVSDASRNNDVSSYLVDYAHHELNGEFTEARLLGGGLSVHTTLDRDLQRAAAEAVERGVANLEKQLPNGGDPGRDASPVQAALIAIDPATGAIRAMVGGRDYGSSQFNRVTEAFRQPGSVFKPFVYAAAFETAYRPAGVAPTGSSPWEAPRDTFARSDSRMGRPDPFRGGRARGSDPTPNDADGLVFDLEDVPEREEDGSILYDRVITPLTTMADEPTYFFYGDGQYYRPDNYGNEFHGLVTAREALERSLNVPTVKIAERVGYDRVAELAHRVGFNENVLPFPSIALGSFEVTPIEVAAAWTAFANNGIRVTPRAVESVRSVDGDVLASFQVESRPVMEPELAALMTRLLEGVVNRGTGARVRSSGFHLPAAGKTGTSRDGWFVGYTKDLLTVVWVGFDDGRELNIDGSRSALPIWTEFMIAAYRIYPPRDSRSTAFVDPPGLVHVAVDADSWTLWAPGCGESRTAYLVRGTEPVLRCNEQDDRYSPQNRID
jgi:membrane peptidoglycan carboxypeptidase